MTKTVLGNVYSDWRVNYIYIRRAFVIAILATIFMLIAREVLKDQLNFLLVDVIKTMAKVSVLAIISVEIFDTYHDRFALLNRVPFSLIDPAFIMEHIGIYPGVEHGATMGQLNIGRAIASALRTGLVMLLCVIIVGVFTGGYTFPVVVVGLFMGTYLSLPATGNDYWLLAAWIACVIMVLVTGLMTFNELIEYQTLTKIFNPLLGGI